MNPKPIVVKVPQPFPKGADPPPKDSPYSARDREAFDWHTFQEAELFTVTRRTRAPGHRLPTRETILFNSFMDAINEAGTDPIAMVYAISLWPDTLHKKHETMVPRSWWKRAYADWMQRQKKKIWKPKRVRRVKTGD